MTKTTCKYCQPTDEAARATDPLALVASEFLYLLAFVKASEYAPTTRNLCRVLWRSKQLGCHWHITPGDVARLNALVEESWRYGEPGRETFAVRLRDARGRTARGALL